MNGFDNLASATMGAADQRKEFWIIRLLPEGREVSRLQQDGTQ